VAVAQFLPVVAESPDRILHIPNTDYRSSCSTADHLTPPVRPDWRSLRGSLGSHETPRWREPDSNHRSRSCVPTADIAVPLEHRVAALQAAYPGISLTKHGPEWRVIVPDALRIGNEAHFAQMARRFLDDVEHRRPPPAWEKPNMLAKYYVCTEGVAVSQP